MKDKSHACLNSFTSWQSLTPKGLPSSSKVACTFSFFKCRQNKEVPFPFWQSRWVGFSTLPCWLSRAFGRGSATDCKCRTLKANALPWPNLASRVFGLLLMNMLLFLVKTSWVWICLKTSCMCASYQKSFSWQWKSLSYESEGLGYPNSTHSFSMDFTNSVQVYSSLFKGKHKPAIKVQVRASLEEKTGHFGDQYSNWTQAEGRSQSSWVAGLCTTSVLTS